VITVSQWQRSLQCVHT